MWHLCAYLVVIEAVRNTIDLLFSYFKHIFSCYFYPFLFVPDTAYIGNPTPQGQGPISLKCLWAHNQNLVKILFVFFDSTD